MVKYTLTIYFVGIKLNSFIPINFQMEKKYSVFLLFLLTQVGFSQTERKINGTVICGGLPVSGIDIVNFSNKQIQITDENGEFSISAKVADMLIIVSKNHEFKRYFINKLDYATKSILVTLENKPEELEEVVIKNYTASDFGFDQESLKLIRNGEIHGGSLKSADYNPIPNGTDFIAIGKSIVDLFSNPKKEEKKITEDHVTAFNKLVSTNFDEDFFSKTLKLKLEEVALFLQFCDADSKSNSLIENFNKLSLMDFLIAKNAEFKKLFPTQE